MYKFNFAKKETKRNRIWELDFIRGIAILLMIYYHIIFDLNDFYNYQVSHNSGINLLVGKSSAILFILVSGVSCCLSRNNFRRGLKLAGIALTITLITILYNPDFCIKFGILHFLGISIMIYPLLYKINLFLLPVIGTIIISAGYFFAGINVSHNYLFPFGVTSSSFSSLDYYPLFPWLGVFIYGITLGKAIYPQKKSIFKTAPRNNFINKAGKHSLLIYLIHQPVILFLLYLLH